MPGLSLKRERDDPNAEEMRRTKAPRLMYGAARSTPRHEDTYAPRSDHSRGQFFPNDLVLAKCLNWPMWPALIKSITGESVHVVFVGDRTTACVPASKIVEYESVIANNIKFRDVAVMRKLKEDVTNADVALTLLELERKPVRFGD